MIPRLFKILSIIAVTTLFSACGGGGGGGSSNPVPVNNTYGISGMVVNAEGVTLTITGATGSFTATTNEVGAFSVSGIEPGDYTITPTQEGFAFNPAQFNVTIGDRDDSSAVFERFEGGGEGLTAEQALQIDALPDETVPAEDIILPNGRSLADFAREQGIPLNPVLGPEGTSQAMTSEVAPQSEVTTQTSDDVSTQAVPATGPQQKKNQMITAMITSAKVFACGREGSDPCVPTNRWTHEADLTNPSIQRPRQEVLAYVTGVINGVLVGKNPTIRTAQQGCLTTETFGLDCSGLIYNVAQAAGISVPKGRAINQQNPKVWDIPPPPKGKIQMKLVTDGTIEAGDIVGWPGHIGIVQSGSSPGTALVISSLGRPGQCTYNNTPPRGPRSLRLSGLESTDLGARTSVLRLVVELTGNYDFKVRCDSSQQVVLSFNFDIGTAEDGTFTATGSGIDLDGEPLSAVLSGTFNETTNVLAAKLVTDGGSRTDEFTQKLNSDDIEFRMTKTSGDPALCSGYGRLIRIQDTDAPIITADAPTKTTESGLPSSTFLGGSAPMRRLE